MMMMIMHTHAILRPFFQIQLGEPVLSQRTDLLEQPVDFYEPDVLPATQCVTMSHIVESCPLTKLNGGLSQLHSADDAAIAWPTNYGS